MNYYIALMKTLDAEKDMAIREEHIQYLNDQIAEGKIIAKGPFTDHTGGLIIFRAESMEEAQLLANQDPAAVEGTREFILKEWKCSIELP